MVNYSLTYTLTDPSPLKMLPVEVLEDEYQVEVGDYIVFESLYSYTAEVSFAKVVDTNPKRAMVVLKNGIRRNMFYGMVGGIPTYVVRSLNISARHILRQRNLKSLLALDPVEMDGRLDIQH